MPSIRPEAPREASSAATGRWRDLAINLGVLVASVCGFLLVCEFVVFRFVCLASDAPANAFVDGLIRYAPNQRGVWRVCNEIAAPFAINGQGWNSGVGDYRIDHR